MYRTESQSAARHRGKRLLSPRPLVVAVNLAMAGGLIAVAAWSPGVQAQQAATRNYTIPAGPLSSVLTQYAGETGIFIGGASDMAQGRQSPGVEGSHTAQSGLSALLSGTGLMAVQRDDGKYDLRPEPLDGGSGEAELATVTVTVTAAADLPGGLPEPYAGGEVARGARMGILGNVDFTDNPRSQIALTDDLVRDRQARTLGDALLSSPAPVVAISHRGDAADAFIIRGFRVSSFQYDGFFGVLPGRKNPIEGIERIELLLGPSAFANGFPPNGEVGGMVNLVPKRAGSEPLTRVTSSYISDRNMGAELDVSRRFGVDESLGLRLNLAGREGDLALDRAGEKLGAVYAALDYAGERLRVLATVGYIDNKFENPQPYLGVRSGFRLPSAPRNTSNFAQQDNFDQYDWRVGSIRAEYDLSDNTTVFAGYAQSSYDYLFFGANYEIINEAGDLQPYSPGLDDFGQRNKGRSFDSGLTTRLKIGSVDHELTFAGSLTQTEVRTRYTVSGSPFTSNLYNPTLLTFPRVSPTDPAFAQDSEPSGFAVADTISMAEGNVLLTLGARHQTIKATRLNPSSLAPISVYDESRTSPGFGLVVKPMPGLSVYTNYSEGLGQGGTAPSTAQNRFEVLPPTVTKQYEVGIKRDFGDLAVTFAAFQIKQPAQFLDTASNIYGEFGEQRNRGLEPSVFGTPMRGLRLLGGVSYIDAKLTETANGVNDGKRALGVPEVLLNLDAEVDVPAVPGLAVFGRVQHAGEAAMDFTGLQTVPGWTRWDAGGSYRFKVGGSALTARLAITNLTNRDYFIAGTDPHLLLAEPRSVSLSLQADF